MDWLVNIEHAIGNLLVYDPKAPLIFSSGLFLFLFTAFALFYGLMRRELLLRMWWVVLFSLYFYYKSSGIYFLLLIFTATSDFFIAHAIAGVATRRAKRWWVTLSIAVNLGMLAYFKYTNFFISIYNELGVGNPLAFKHIFLPVGISFFVFQSLSYTIDVCRGRIAPLRSWLDYLFYLSFFPQLVAGPIVRARDFLPQIRKPVVVSREMFGTGVFLILSGLFKKAVISDYISLNFVDRIFDNPLLYSGLENLLGIYGYTLQIYCDFSGYSDMAIGLALLLGFHFNQNFDSPYKSATITEFWRRWHISLSSWLKDYLYISLGGNRKGKFRTYLNLMITMLLGGLWHGAAWRFVLWGGLHGAALALHKGAMSLIPSLKATGGQMSVWGRMIGVLVTFHIVCFGWIFFRAKDLQTGWTMLRQIADHFGGALWSQVMSGYAPILILMAVGYALHFTPRRWELGFRTRMMRLPLGAMAVLAVVLIWFIMQIKSSEIQPFIYFQF